MSTDIVVRTAPTSSLAITDDQVEFNDKQRFALGLGKNVTNADVAIYFHVCRRTGLDPFARQIYMLERWTKDGPRQTIQTGIDGYRLIARRAGRYSIAKRVWLDEDGNERNLWLKKWGPPAACMVIVDRDGDQFPAVAMFDEYAQTTKSGDLAAMWRNMPANQIAKCAEALALRMAFPQDLSGIYVEDEMHQADSHPRQESATKATGMDALRATVRPEAEPTEGEVIDPEPAPADETGEAITPAQLKALHAGLADLGIGKASDRATALKFCGNVIGRRVESSKDLTKAEASAILDEIAAEKDRAAEAGEQA